MRLALQLDVVRVPARRERQERGSGTAGFMVVTSTEASPLRLAVEVAARGKQPVRQLLLQMHRVRALEIGLLLVGGRRRHRRRAQIVEAVVLPACAQAIPFAPEIVA